MFVEGKKEESFSSPIYIVVWKADQTWKQNTGFLYGVLYIHLLIKQLFNIYNYSQGPVLGTDDVKFHKTSLCFQEPSRLIQKDI